MTHYQGTQVLQHYMNMDFEDMETVHTRSSTDTFPTASSVESPAPIETVQNIPINHIDPMTNNIPKGQHRFKLRKRHNVPISSLMQFASPSPEKPIADNIETIETAESVQTSAELKEESPPQHPPEADPFRHVDLLPLIPSRMYYNPELCIPAIVDHESNGYNICKVWQERGFLSDIDPMYDIKKWQTPQPQGVNVTMMIYKDADIALNELADDDIANSFLLNHKNRILEFIHDEHKRESIIKQFNGESFKAKSLKLIRSRKEIKTALENIQSLDTNIRLISLFIEFKWNQDKYHLSIKPRRNNQPQERSVMLCLFVFNGAVVDGLDDVLVLKSCLVTRRNTWIKAMYDKPPYHQIFYHFLYLSQFWLHCLSIDIAPYWSAHYCDNKELQLSTLTIPAQYIPYFYEKRFRIYNDDGDTFSVWYHRKHFCRRYDIDPPQVIIGSDDDDEEEDDEEEDWENAWKVFDDNVNVAREEFVDIGVESFDGIFSAEDIEHIMHDIDHYLEGTQQPHFALEYKLQEMEKNVITQKCPGVISILGNYKHATYRVYDEGNWSSAEEETDEDKEKKLICMGYYNFIPKDKQKVNPHQNAQDLQDDDQNDMESDNRIDQILHDAGNIPIPQHFQLEQQKVQMFNAFANGTINIDDDGDEDNASVIYDHTGYKPAQPTIPLLESDDDEPESKKEAKPEARYGTKQYHEKILKRYVFKYKKIQRMIRHREVLRQAMSDLNAGFLRCYMHENNICNVNCINITNKLPTFWTEAIKPQLLKYELNTFINYFQFAFVYQCKATSDNMKIPVFDLKCDRETLRFQNSEMCLMVFSTQTVTLYLDDISLIVKPGRIYSFDYDTISSDYIQIFNQKNITIDVVILRHTPCHTPEDPDDEKYLYIDLNSYIDDVELIQIGSDGEFHIVTEDDDGFPILGEVYDDGMKKHNDDMVCDVDTDSDTDSESEGASVDGMNEATDYVTAALSAHINADTSSDTDADSVFDTDNEIDWESISDSAVSEMMMTDYEKQLVKQEVERELRLLNQNVLQFNVVKETDAAEKLNQSKEKINKAFDDYEDPEKRRKYWKKLQKKEPKFVDEIQFYIGNSYELQNNYTEAIKYFKKSLKENEKCKSYYKSLTLYHQYRCTEKQYGVGSIEPHLLNLMEEAWKNTVSDDEQHGLIRSEWLSSGETVEELFGAAECAMALAQYHEDKLGGQRNYNDTSLLWYKRTLNILERAGYIKIHMVPLHHVVDKEHIDTLLNGEESKDEETIERKRINVPGIKKKDTEILGTIENLIQNYQTCIIERILQKNNYSKNEADIENKPCFVDFHRLKDDYLSDFNLYLQYEVDTLFEMNHYLFQTEISKENNTAVQIADVYINYAAYLQDVAKETGSALRLYEYSLKYNVDHTAYLNMADIYIEKHRYDKALECVDLALQCTPKEADNYEETVDEMMQFKKQIETKRISDSLCQNIVNHT